jgi:hypothetical protein
MLMGVLDRSERKTVGMKMSSGNLGEKKQEA